MQCTLCSEHSEFYCADRKRSYYRCLTCDLVFADPDSLIAETDEKAIYDFHENDPYDERYRQFLSQLSEPLLTKLKKGMRGLDFGCGPGPTLNLMLEEQGMQVELYDLYYYPDKAKLQQRYDFVTASEVVEHFAHPARSWQQLFSLIKPASWLAVMTSLNELKTTASFKNWNYKNDPTHVSFYSRQTINWLAERYQADYEIVNGRVMLFRC
ncbi:class I SAM-dependent methyltransferase [Idiomarina sp.]|uniref:class I SAM-dependent methyltransferase n=1 Tax=Idiomarina sp. TaxID=1874361 RepID=UPI0025C691FF|nr:class I SAM-dependent methyltransferase [Idiomarina sp.]